MEEAIAFSNIPVCGYIYRVSNREKRISAVRYYATDKSKCRHNVMGKVDFHFDREGRVVKMERGDGVYEVEYGPVLIVLAEKSNVGKMMLPVD